MTRPLANQRGVALIIVLVIVALLTVTVIEFTHSTQIDQHRARNAVHALQAQLLARSGLNLAEGFLMMDDEPQYDAYSEQWWLDLLEFCKEMQLDETMRIRCTVRDESGKINLNNTREPRRNVQSQAVTASAVLRDAMRCMFQRRNIDVEVVDKLADYWQQDAPPNPDGTLGQIPDFGSLEDFGATFGIPSEKLQQLRPFVTAQPRALMRQININTAPPEVLAAIIHADKADCPPEDPVPEIIERQRDIDNPIKSTGEITGLLSGLDNAAIKATLFGVNSRLYRLESSALTNVDPDNQMTGGIGQTLSALVARQVGAAKPQNARGVLQGGGQQQAVGANGKPLPNWTLRPLDWQKEGGARLFRKAPGEEEETPGPEDEEGTEAGDDFSG
jgi:general secretion pathway protein K